jgi:hypothetical protein
MTDQDRIDSLKNQHRNLDTKIQTENSRLHPDDAVVAQLKRQKLKIKDELAHLHAL